MNRRIKTRVIYVGLPLFVIMLPVVVGSFIVAMAWDAIQTGIEIYEQLYQWSKK